MGILDSLGNLFFPLYPASQSDVLACFVYICLSGSELHYSASSSVEELKKDTFINFDVSAA